jgi:hypothetical protein
MKQQMAENKGHVRQNFFISRPNAIAVLPHRFFRQLSSSMVGKLQLHERPSHVPALLYMQWGLVLAMSDLYEGFRGWSTILTAGDSSGMVLSVHQLWGGLAKHSERIWGVAAACFLEKELRTRAAIPVEDHCKLWEFLMSVMHIWQGMWWMLWYALHV